MAGSSSSLTSVPLPWNSLPRIRYRRALRVLAIIVAVTFTNTPSMVDALYSNNNACTIDLMPIVLLWRDPISGNFTLVKRFHNGEEDDDDFEDDSGNVTAGGDNATAWDDGQFRSLRWLTLPQDHQDSLQNDDSNDKEEEEGDGVAAVTVEDWRFSTTSSPADLVGDERFGIAGSLLRRNSIRIFPGVTATTDSGAIRIINVDRYLKMNDTNNGINMTDKTNLFYARECGCFYPPDPVVYCPMAVHACLQQVPFSWGIVQGDPPVGDRVPGCQDLPQSHFQAVTFAIAMTFSSILLLTLMYTRMGWNVIDLVINTCCYRRWNERLVRIIPRRNPRLRDWLLRSHLLRERRDSERARVRQERDRRRHEGLNRSGEEGPRHEQGGRHIGLPGEHPVLIVQRHPTNQQTNDVMPTLDQNSRLPTSLRLRTRIYHPKNGEGDDDGDRTCSICLVALMDGDRVGVLYCRHSGMMHSKCLKSWLRRKNACPLCQALQVAAPGYDIVAGPTNDETDGSSLVSSSSSSSNSSNSTLSLPEQTLTLELPERHDLAE